MKVADIGPFEEVFTHVDDETGEQTTWAASRLYAHCEAVKNPDWQSAVPVEEYHASFCVKARGVERHRIERLLANVTALTKPILFVDLPDGSKLLVDGTHRYVAMYLLHIPAILAYTVPYEVAKAFIIEDAGPIDPGQLNSWSGM